MSSLEGPAPGGSASVAKPPAKPARRSLFRRYPSLRWWLVVAVLVGGGLAVRYARPAYHHLKEQRGRRMAPGIQRLLGEGPTRLAEAGQKLRVALALAPDDPLVLRQAAQYSYRARVESGLDYFQKLADAGEATRQDRLDHATMAVALNRLEMAFDEVKELLEQDPDDRDALGLRIRIFERKEDFSRALSAAAGALRRHPLDENLQLSFGSLLLAGTNEERRAQGRRLLRGLAVGEGPFREPAADRLAGITNLVRAEDEALLQELTRRPKATLGDRLNAAKIRLRLEPGQRDQVLDAMLTQFHGVTDANELGRFAIWLLTLDEPAVVLRAVPAELAQTDGHLLACRLEALAALDRWEELQPQLEAPSPMLDPVELHCLRARAAVRGERPASPEPHFELAIGAAGGHPLRLAFVARQAELAGKPAIAIEAWKGILPNSTFALQAAGEILRLAQPLDDLRLVRNTLARVAVFVPNDDPLAAQVAYLNLVLDEDVAAARESLKRLQASHPGDSRYRIFLALAELRSRDPAAALALLEPDNPDWAAAEDRLRLIYVVVLAANAHGDAARQMARKIETQKLRSPEREIIRPWL